MTLDPRPERSDSQSMRSEGLGSEIPTPGPPMPWQVPPAPAPETWWPGSAALPTPEPEPTQHLPAPVQQPSGNVNTQPQTSGAQLKALALEAAQKADLLYRFEKASVTLIQFGTRLDFASRRTLVSCGAGALGMVGSGLLLPFPQSFLLAPLCGLAAAFLAASIVPSNEREIRDVELRKLEERIEYAKSNGFEDGLVREMQERYVSLNTSDIGSLQYMVKKPVERQYTSIPESLNGSRSDGRPA